MDKSFFNDRYYSNLLFILFIAFCIIFMGIGLRDPWPADEPRFVEAAKEMVDSGRWFFPLRGGELYPDKPPIFMWSIALLYKLTGNLSATFLIPNAIAGLITLLCVFDLAAKLWNVNTARNASMLLLIAPQFVIQAKAAQIDAMVACWITVTMYGLVRHFFVKPNMRWYLFSWVCMALGILTKGVGFLPLLIFVPLLFLHFVKKEQFAAPINFKLWFGPLTMLGTLMLWLLPVLYFAASKDNPDFTAYRDNILLQQTAQRYANPTGHLKPWYYFIVSVVPLLWFPLYLFLFSKKSWVEIKASPLLQTLLVWVVCVVIFFSISPGKRGVYILPALPMLALAMAAIISQTRVASWVNKVLTGFAAIFALVFITATIMSLIGSSKLTKQLGDELLPFAALFALAAATWIAALWRYKLQLTLPRFGAALAVTWLLYGSLGYVLMNPTRTPAKQIMATVKERIGAEGELGLTLLKEQFLLFSTIPMTHFSYLSSHPEQYRNAWLWMNEKDNRYILTQARDKGVVCFDLNKGVLIGNAHRRDWILLDKSTMTSECQAPKEVKRYYTPQLHFYDNL
ncbi:glycosyltransferase family 39 protein [Motilimonas sp. E26]|uniref:ArnT family glycosyltransferase n=1 Tax=Motilimonas sp. E26 TaxID=2865674 RepID=UPI001E4AA9D6|nr:glycosyltransferase family 39 protein [Motilimonas sp. E26]MCE0555918.1 glycosyltransferase family 39 protein [Motilimonas sp. E26]